MSSQEQSISPTPLIEEVPWTSAESSVFSPASTNEISNELSDETNNEANDKYFQTTGFLNDNRKKRQMTNKIKPSTSIPTLTKNERANATYMEFFFETDKKNDQIKYCKICVKECENTRTRPYPYFKSGGSTGHLT
ncbi:8239_t:CDS:1, partial [Cetraspora pellucida]